MENNTNSTELIQLVQLPIIEQHLFPLKHEWQEKARFAASVVVTENNLQSIKNQRTQMRKEFDDFESLRKTIKAGVGKPYMEFEEIYKECIANSFKVADNEFKKKIDAVENGIKADGEDRLMGYFNELCAAYHVEWLTYDQLNVKMSKANATSKTQKAIKEQIAAAIQRISDEVGVISELSWPEEVLVEYRKTLDMNGAFMVVKERHANLEAVQREQQERKEAVEQEQKAVEKVETLLPPTPVEPITKGEKPENDPILTAQFKVKATKSKLIVLRTWLHENGYEIQ